jgi:hypothetical protein
MVFDRRARLSCFAHGVAHACGARDPAALNRSSEAVILVGLVFEAWLGLFFAWCASARIRADGPWSQPALSMVVSFTLIILLPSTAYLYLAHPDWCWMYLVDAGRVPRLFVVPIAAASCAALIGGYYGGGRLLRNDRMQRFPTLALTVAAVVAVAIAFAFHDRLLHYGSYRDWQLGRALPLLEVKLGYVLIAMIIGVVSAAAFVGWELLRDGRRAIAMRDSTHRPNPRVP